jgi:hypothetical protein
MKLRVFSCNPCQAVSSPAVPRIQRRALVVLYLNFFVWRLGVIGPGGRRHDSSRQELPCAV